MLRTSCHSNRGGGNKKYQKNKNILLKSDRINERQHQRTHIRDIRVCACVAKINKTSNVKKLLQELIPLRDDYQAEEVDVAAISL